MCLCQGCIMLLLQGCITLHTTLGSCHHWSNLNLLRRPDQLTKQISLLLFAWLYRMYMHALLYHIADCLPEGEDCHVVTILLAYAIANHRNISWHLPVQAYVESFFFLAAQLIRVLQLQSKVASSRRHCVRKSTNVICFSNYNH